MICVVAKFVFNAGKINEFIDILHSPDGLAVTRAYCVGHLGVNFRRPTKVGH